MGPIDAIPTPAASPVSTPFVTQQPIVAGLSWWDHVSSNVLTWAPLRKLG